MCYRNAEDNSNEVEDEVRHKCNRPWHVTPKSPGASIGKSLQICRTNNNYKYNHKKSFQEDYNVQEAVFEKVAKEKVQYYKFPSTIKSSSTSYTSITRSSIDFKSLNLTKSENPVKSTRSVRLRNIGGKKNVGTNKSNPREEKT